LPDYRRRSRENTNVPFKFTGTIDKVTIEVKAMKAADTGEAEQSRKEAALKKGLSE
jgi:arylsulfatase